MGAAAGSACRGIERPCSLQCEGEEWVRVALAAAEAKEAAGRSLASLSQWQREQVWEKARASVYAIVLQDKEDECLMVALRSLEADGWLVHSLQQDGVLAEPGRLASGVGATPLATLAPRVSQAIRAKGLRTPKGPTIGERTRSQC